MALQFIYDSIRCIEPLPLSSSASALALSLALSSSVDRHTSQTQMNDGEMRFSIERHSLAFLLGLLINEMDGCMVGE